MSAIPKVSSPVESQKLTQNQKYISGGIGCTVGVFGLITTFSATLFSAIIAGFSHDNPNASSFSHFLVRAMPTIIFVGGTLGSLSLADSSRRLTETAFRALQKEPKTTKPQK